jgi:hypothetical protein
MNSWLLIAIAVALLLLMTLREHYVEREGPGERPSFDGAEGGAWRSKIDAQIPIGGSDDDYMKALQKFYDEIYSPLRTENKTASPRDTQVETFLDGLTIPNISKDALRQIILSGFSIDKTGSAAAREQKQIKFTPTEALEPRDGVDQVYGHRKEEIYTPADRRRGTLPEGVYADTEQTEPSREGLWNDNSTSWSPAAFASVCEGGKCAQNVL